MSSKQTTYLHDLRDLLDSFIRSKVNHPATKMPSELQRLLLQFIKQHDLITQIQRFRYPLAPLGNGTSMDILVRIAGDVDRTIERLELRASTGARAPDSGREAMKTGARSSGGQDPDRQFICLGDTWKVVFDGREFQVGNSRGLRYVAELLANPKAPIECSRLASLRRPQNAMGRMMKAKDANLDDDRLLGDFVADETAIQAVRAQLELTDDPATREKLAMYLKAATSSSGLGRRTGGSERSRTAVRNCIARALKKIGAHDKRLQQYLNSAIETGRACVFTPVPGDPTWRVGFYG